MNREPSVIIGAISAAVAAVLVLIVSFGLHITDDQQSAILGVIAPVGLLIASGVIRGRVYAPASVARLTTRKIADADTDRRL